MGDLGPSLVSFHIVFVFNSTSLAGADCVNVYGGYFSIDNGVHYHNYHDYHD